MFGIGIWEVILVLFLMLLLFGPKELPRLARSFGKIVRDVQRAWWSVQSEIEREVDETLPDHRSVSEKEKDVDS